MVGYDFHGVINVLLNFIKDKELSRSIKQFILFIAKYLHCFWRPRRIRARSSGRAARCGCPSLRTSTASSPSSANEKFA